MVIPVDEPQEENQVIVESISEVEEVSISPTSKKSDIKFDFAVEDTDRPGLVVYTVSTQPAEEEPITLSILAPHYGIALELAGINKNNTVKVSEVPFEG